MDISSRLTDIVGRHHLNRHPFYEEWRKGTLPQATLATYAEEYGQLVALMPDPWTLLGDMAIAQEERDHQLMWDGFAQSLNTAVPPAPRLAEVQRLIATARSLFARPETAIGALFAFEAQQPSTSTSKLEGLLRHYPALDPALYSEYFVVHSHNDHESEALLAMAATLDEPGREAAVEACEQMCLALWDALTGIHGTERSCAES